MAPEDRHVTLRGMTKIRKEIEDLGTDIKLIRDKGFAAVTSTSQRNIFRGMFYNLQLFYDKFMKAWLTAIEYSDTHTLDPAFPSDADKAYLAGVKNCFHEATGYHVQIEALTNPIPTQQPTSNLSQSAFSQFLPARTILPKIKIKPFNGNFAQWPTFKQLFIALIKEETSLSDIERFHFLVTYLEGPALDVIKHINITGNNFNQAWSALTKFYDQERKIATYYLEQILNFKPLSGKPTAEALQAFLSCVTESITSLKDLNIPNLGEYLLCELALRGLDPGTRERFESSIVGTNFPTSLQLTEFVHNRCSVLRITAKDIAPKVAEVTKSFSKPKSPNDFSSKSHALLAHGTKESNDGASSNQQFKSLRRLEQGELSCFVCKGKHTISDCFKFKSATPVQRLDSLRDWSGCRNCLHPFHKTRDCPSQWRCKECKGRHHSWLHLPTSDPQPRPLSSSTIPNTYNQQQQSAQTASPTAFSGANTSSSNSGVLLGTVIAHLKNSRGSSQAFRGILDPGSHYSFITEACARKLGKPSRPFHGSIAGVNQSPLSHASGIVKLSFLPVSSSSSQSSLETEAVVVPTITSSLPPVPLQSSMWIDYQSFDLSDPNFITPGPISFLIGADLYPDIVTSAPITIHATGPKLINTVFGFTVIGRFDNEHDTSKSVSLLTMAADSEFPLEKFWEIEEPSVVPHLSPDEERCEAHFIESHRRTSDGVYVVSLPFKDDRHLLVPNIPRALSRFYALENKLAKDDELRQEYLDFMRQYLDLGHMSLATSKPSYVIPHHPVLKIDTEGNRKLRVVFDASFRSSSGSLNDHLLTGCKLQADIGQIMLNFRRFQFVLTCDIVKMFRQIIVEPADRTFQQIIWRFDPSEPISFYELNTVTYGVRSSPYQAQRVLRQLVQDEGDKFPLAADALCNSLYVDDVAGGSSDVAGLLDLRSQLVSLLSLGGFALSKWNSNYAPLLHDESVSSNPVPFGAEEITAKILGMQWNPSTDNFSYKVDVPPAGYTKRVILSTIARLYDPLGYLSPAVFYAKRILQETWKSGVGWDEDVPNAVKERWRLFVDCLQSLSDILIPRALPQSSSYQILAFSDASEQGYCGVVYLRATHGTCTSLTLLKSKTKLAPLKMLTVPRLELCAALLLTEVIKSVENLIKQLHVETLFCFTDSTVVLCWLNTPVHTLQTFVANRVQQIKNTVDPSCWYHIRGVDNPADVGSRGVLPSALLDHQLWWSGPSWCCQPIRDWPVAQEVAPPVVLPEIKQNHLSLLTVDSQDEFITYMHRHSSYLRLVRVMAYVKRFISNCKIPSRRKRRRIRGPISASEFDSARKHCIRIVQHRYLPQVFASRDFDNLPLELRRLAVFIDHENLVRVGGRLTNAPVPSDHKFPLLLPTKAHFTTLIVSHLHNQNHHLGPSGLLAALRQQYWVPRAKNLVKLQKLKCVVCVRYSKSFRHPFMGDLPPSRFNNVRPFLNTGVDFAGPFLCKEGARRNARAHKSYLCLFICLSTRALHLELATSLTVGGFLDAFERFTARRGLPAHMFSDCGRNFVGTARYLREISDWMGREEVRSSIETHTAHLAVQWSFNPPFSPHFGGGWEAGVKSLKSLLYKSFGNHPYTENELSTMFTKAEGILNSRPLQPLSDSPEDLEPLTPGHFLIGQPLNALPEPNLTDVPANRLDKWQQIRQRIQFFWARWREEYLSSLQLRQKWNKRTPNLQVGDIVIITDCNTPPMQWPMARITAVHPGKDDIVRVVTLRTAKGIYKRSTVNLISLPVSSDP